MVKKKIVGDKKKGIFEDAPSPMSNKQSGFDVDNENENVYEIATGNKTDAQGGGGDEIEELVASEMGEEDALADIFRETDGIKKDKRPPPPYPSDDLDAL